jgi:predicted ATPase/DNA-binding SARP family transcriptional activator
VTVRARLFGTGAIEHEDTWLELPSSRTSALLFYLAYQGGWVSRGELVLLLWPDTLEKKARGNLRQHLYAIKKLPYTAALEVEASRVRWPVDTDVKAFHRALHGRRLGVAAELYQGELLQGFHLVDAPEFDTWLAEERQDLHRIWREALLNFATELEAAERYTPAAEALERLYGVEPLDEEVFQRFLKALHLGGQRAKALRVSQDFRQLLSREFGSEPEEATLQLIEWIEGGEKVASTPQSELQTGRVPVPEQHRHNLPSQPTKFVGRKVEQDVIAGELADPNCRLLTLAGPGGMGKTRLAIEVARGQIDAYEDGVTFVPLESVDAAEFMLYAIADALEVRFFGQAAPIDQLLAFLQDKALLLVLDNLEHLLAGVHLIAEILARAPQLKVLATSRERLNLQAERVFDLQGLAVPEVEAPDIAASDALEMFVQCARNNRLDFELDIGNAEALVHICQLVQGMPLAIELTASWLRVLGVEDIATELGKGIGILQASTRDLPARHRSIRAVFDHSWQLLSERDRAVMRKLAVFQDGFRREAAAELAGADVFTLARLVDKSLLRTDANGRYVQHPLVREYALEKLTEDPEEQLRTRDHHCSFYFRFIEDRNEERWTVRAGKALEAFDEELEDIRAAWHWALEHQRFEEINSSLEPLLWYFDIRARYEEAIEIYAAAAAVLSDREAAHQQVLGNILLRQAVFNLRSARFDRAFQLASRGLDLVRPFGDTFAVMEGLMILGNIAEYKGAYATSKEHHEGCLALLRELDEPGLMAIQLKNLGNVEHRLGNGAVAREYFRKAVDLAKAQNSPVAMVVALGHFGAFSRVEDGPQAAQPLLAEGLELARSLGLQLELPNLLRQAGLAVRSLGDFDESQKFLHEALTMVQQGRDRMAEAPTLIALGKVDIGAAEYGDALTHLRQGLRLAWSVQEIPTVMHGLLCYAELQASQGQEAEAYELLCFTLVHEAADQQLKCEAQRLQTALQKKLSPEEAEVAVERGRVLKLNQAVARALG